ncbi:hypothetical protein C8Q78DRAFT_746115 [Trametes maxima]|nr:hypothetical protein C8Q78DRAFT_746115 [Trametes maxima]
MSLDFGNLNSDVLYMIIEQVPAISGEMEAVKSLSLTSRRIRAHCMPVLFKTCVASRSVGEIPPATIRGFVEHLKYRTPFVSFDERFAKGYVAGPVSIYQKPFELPFSPSWTELSFGRELDYLPALRSITFTSARGGVPWSVILKCLSYPHITSISFDEQSAWTCVASPSLQPDSPTRTQLGLTEMHYVVDQWRDVQGAIARSNMQAARTLESSFLRALVLRMSDTAVSLTMPAETAPLLEMSKLNWPRLTVLSLSGQWMDSDQCSHLQRLLRHLPSLRSLSVQVFRCCGVPCPRIFEETSGLRLRLHSLTIAYPDPADGLFSSLTDELACLSLRDSPRYYLYPQSTGWMPMDMETPLLTSTDVLSILRRLPAPKLVKLELVYQADDAEFELLRYLSFAFPLLQDLEMHRYRLSEEDDIPYLSIAEALTSFTHLRAAYLNFNFPDIVLQTWDNPELEDECSVLLENRGWEVLRTLQGGRNFEYLAMLVRPPHTGAWVQFRPPWYPYCRPDWRIEHHANDATAVSTWNLYFVIVPMRH